ncbi:hypothetical protein FB451DRAFT_1182566 [Mycena latifolia]|nr:hypothetical protein FB451DRAFT_1182566 [Mycena latifolia]
MGAFHGTAFEVEKSQGDQYAAMLPNGNSPSPTQFSPPDTACLIRAAPTDVPLIGGFSPWIWESDHQPRVLSTPHSASGAQMNIRAQPSVVDDGWDYAFESSAHCANNGDLFAHSRPQRRSAATVPEEDGVPLNTGASHQHHQEVGRPRTGHGHHTTSSHNMDPYATNLFDTASLGSFRVSEQTPGCPSLHEPTAHTWPPVCPPYIHPSYNSSPTHTTDHREPPQLGRTVCYPTKDDIARWPQMFPQEARKLPKRQTLACLFCRERKIGCTRPDIDEADQTCNTHYTSANVCVAKFNASTQPNPGGGHTPDAATRRSQTSMQLSALKLLVLTPAPGGRRKCGKWLKNALFGQNCGDSTAAVAKPNTDVKVVHLMLGSAHKSFGLSRSFAHPVYCLFPKPRPIASPAKKQVYTTNFKRKLGDETRNGFFPTGLE